MKIANREFDNRTVLMVLGVLAVFLIAYFLIIPTVVARHYLGRISSKAAEAKASLETVSAGPNAVVFEDPDIPPDERQALIAETLESIRGAQASLDALQEANDLPPLPGGGVAKLYHKASVRHSRINNAVRQSRQVLDEYAQKLAYADAYASAQLHLGRMLEYVNSILDFNLFAGRGSIMTTIAEQLRADREQLAAQTPPPDFIQLHANALQMLDEAAVVFERLGRGLDANSYIITYTAIAELERIAIEHESEDSNNLTTLAQQSSTLRQLAELPEKIEHIEGPP